MQDNNEWKLMNQSIHWLSYSISQETWVTVWNCLKKLKKYSWTVWNCFENCVLENLNSLLSAREDKGDGRIFIKSLNLTSVWFIKLICGSNNWSARVNYII